MGTERFCGACGIETPRGATVIISFDESTRAVSKKYDYDACAGRNGEPCKGRVEVPWEKKEEKDERLPIPQSDR